jgi:SAM-dependent methyltransferase
VAGTKVSRRRLLVRQAERTRGLRHPLYERIGVAEAPRVLDVGCGDGSVTEDVAALRTGPLVAVDVNPLMVERARRRLARFEHVTVEQADAVRLPFEAGAFDLVVCHLTLMWVADAAKAVREMARVVRPGGLVVAVMEPDYGGKIHFPENPMVDHVFADEMIRRRGGDPHMGRKLRALFARAGLAVQVGLLNPQVPSCEEDLGRYEAERGMYRRMLLYSGVLQKAVEAWEAEYVASLKDGTQFNFLPMFYAVGRKATARA